MLVLTSKITVLVIGVTVLVLAGWGIFVPEKLRTWVSSTMDKHWGIYIAVIVRLVLGSALIVVAPASRFPVVFQVLGLLTIVVAIVVALMGRERIRRFLAWFSERFSAPVIRLWLLFGMAFAGFLVYGVL
jgi:hypothetical protein